MNNICFKSLIIFISSITIFSVFGEVSSDDPSESHEEVLLLKFENDCVHNQNIDQTQCDDLMGQLSEVLTENEVEEQGGALVGTCGRSLEDDSSIENAENLGDDISAAASKMQCTQEDIKEVAKVCHVDMMCNLSRSVATAVDKVAPDFISKRIRGGMESALSDMPSSSQCMDSDQSDCLTEVVTSFVANIVGTFNTLRDVAKAAVKSIWGLKDYLFKKSDDLHTAANSTQSEISKFIDSPWGYIKDKFISMKNAVDTWVKKEVFCQKWEGTPHRSECLEPLNEYDCLNCNDGMNAFCAGAGVFASEAFIAVSTAGTLTAANIALKAGLRLGAHAATKAAARISAKVPSLNTPKTGSRSGVVSAISKTASVSMATLKKIATAMGNYKKKIGESAITRHLVSLEKGVENAMATATKPLSFFDDMAEGIMKKIVASGASKKGTDRMSHFIRAASRYERVRIADVLRRGERLTSNSRKLMTARSTRRVWGSRSGGDSALSRGAQTPDGFTGGVKHDTSNAPASSNPSGSKGNQNQLNGNDNHLAGSQREREIELQRQRDQQLQRDREKQRELEREKQKHAEAEQKSEDSGSKSSPFPSDIAKFTRIALAGDISAKAYRNFQDNDMNTADFVTQEAAQNILNDQSNFGLNPNQSTTLDKSSMEDRTGQNFSSQEEARDFANSMRRKYTNARNRDQIINSFRDKGFSYEDANGLYESEKKYYEQSFLSNREAQMAKAFNGVNQNAKQSAYQKAIGEGEKASDLIQSIRSQIAAIEDDIENEGRAREDYRPAARVTPRPTPRSIATPSSFYAAAQRSFANSSSGASGSPSVGTAPVGEGALESLEGEASEDGRTPASVEEGKLDEELIADSDKGSDSDPSDMANISEEKISEEVDPDRMGKVDYLDLYFKLMENATTGFEFSAATVEDQRLTRGQININDYEVLNLEVKNKAYKIFRHKESKESVAFRLNSQGLDLLEDFPKDLI